MTDAFARRYRLLDRIAIGGTAEVFHARLVKDDGGERPVVIKRVLPQFARDSRFRRLFLEEACVAVTLSHPNIVKVLDHGEIGQTCYIALEPVDGGDLAKLISRARTASIPLRYGLAALLAAEVAEALHFIHEHTSSEGMPLRIIHRDVSPQNILVSRQGVVKLTDFGIAKSAIRNERTVDGTIRGKLDYMAPEQARSGAEIDQRADIFGLGCVLYDLLVGQPPFRGASDVETIDRLRQGKIHRPPSQLGLPAALEKVLQRALEPDPRVRYQRAAMMAHDLTTFIGSLEIPPDRMALATWVGQVLEAPAADRSRSRADDAVRMLLGDGGCGDEDAAALPSINVAARAPNRAPNTSVFASIAEPVAPSPGGNTAEIASPTPRRRWLWGAPLLALALLGWLLWAVDRPQPPLEGPAPDVPDGAAETRLEADASPGPKRKRLHIRSRPPGATVSVNGSKRGLTPLTLELSPGERVFVELRLRGHLRWRRELTAADAPAAISARLVRARRPAARSSSGHLTINSLPWTRVFIDGVFVGNTPLLRFKVRAGARRVQLKTPSGETRRSFVATVPSGGARAYTFNLSQ